MPRARLPISLFAMVMGTAGLGLAWRAAAHVLQLPAWPGEAWLLIALICFVALSIATLRRLWSHPEGLREEVLDRATGGLAACLPIGGSLLAGGLHAYVPAAAVGLWWASAALLLALQIILLAQWFQGGFALNEVNGSWMILLLGGLALPLSGPTVGAMEATRVMFGASLGFMPAIMTLVFARIVVGPPVAPAARPLWFVFLVPPSLVYVGMPMLTGAPAGLALEALLYLSLLLLAALIVASRDVGRWPFGPAWWAFTFPLDAIAGAVARYASVYPSIWTRALALLMLSAAFVVVTLVLARTLAALARGSLGVPVPATRSE